MSDLRWVKMNGWHFRHMQLLEDPMLAISPFDDKPHNALLKTGSGWLGETSRKIWACSLLICHGKGKTVKTQICPSCMLLSTLKRPVDDIQCANTVMGKCSRLARCQLSISEYIFVKQLSSYQQPSICPHSRSQLASYPRRSSLQFGCFSPSHRRWIPCSPWKQLSVRFNSASVWLA